jgi:uncharacterized protein
MAQGTAPCPYDSNSRNIYLGITKRRGRGVFALRRFTAGEIIETCHVIVIPAAQWPRIENTVFFDYAFQWGSDGQTAAIAMGYGSFYNHSYTPNAVYAKRIEDVAIDFTALREIGEGEEIVVNYNGRPDGREALWFPVL